MSTPSRTRGYRALALALANLLLGGLFSTTHAQVTTNITSSGLGTTVSQAGTTWNITGGTRPGNGSNLFHSFGSFNVGAGNTANFCNGCGAAPLVGIQNILGRVTGEGGPPQVSNIFGTIQTTGFGTANLFLMNPAGWIFGPTAQLNVGGSFHATTANYVGLADGTRFNSVPSSADNLLTTASPVAFGFLTSNPAPIDVRTGVFDSGAALANRYKNVLQVPVGQTISFVGGTVNVGAAGSPPQGFVWAPGGRVNLISVASPGEASFNNDRSINVGGFAQLGDINIKGNSFIDAKNVFIRSGRLTIEDATVFPGLLFNNGVPGAQAPDGGGVDIGVSGEVKITATGASVVNQPGVQVFAGSSRLVVQGPVQGDVPSVHIDANAVSLSGPNAVIIALRFGPEKLNSPDIKINTQALSVKDGARIELQNFYQGSGGSLTINADTITIANDVNSTSATGIRAQSRFHPTYGVFNTFGSSAFLSSLTNGNSGSIALNSDNLTIRGPAAISTDSFAFGNSGAITLNTRNALFTGLGTISSQSGLAGNTGDITIRATGQIQMQDGFRVTATTGGSGNAGTVSVIAGGPVEMVGTDTRITSTTVQAADNDPALTAFARLYDTFFRLTRGIRTLDYPSLRQALGIAPHNGDLMNVLAALNKQGLAAVAKTTPGDAGKIVITAPSLTMNGNTRIETSTGGDGNAGAVVADLGSLFLNNGAAIRSASGTTLPPPSGLFRLGAGNAGTVTITTSDQMSISGRSPTTGSGSSISTTTQGAGNGGDIVLNSAGTVQISNGGIVTADSTGAGLAGNITINAGNQIVMTDGSVSTRAVTSDGGNITLNAPNLIQLTDSQVTTSVESGVGTGGNIRIDPQALILNNSNILANAFGGPGGNINIIADVFLVNSNGQFPTSLTGIVDASSALSTPGTVNIEATFTNVEGTVTLLPETPLKATELLRAACAARFAGGKTSSLVVGGRDGLPPQPGDLLPSPLYLASDANTAAPGATTMTGYTQFSDLSFLGSRDRRLDRYTLLPNGKCS
jgi:filamentous hemagglutinin family protein